MLEKTKQTAARSSRQLREVPFRELVERAERESEHQLKSAGKSEAERLRERVKQLQETVVYLNSRIPVAKKDGRPPIIDPDAIEAALEGKFSLDEIKNEKIAELVRKIKKQFGKINARTLRRGVSDARRSIIGRESVHRLLKNWPKVP
jgi:hypothetical protein